MTEEPEPDDEYEYDPFEFTFGSMRMQDTDEDISRENRSLRPAHKEVLEHLEDDEWKSRKRLLSETDLTKTSLRRRLNELMDRNRIEERKAPDDQRKRQYQKT